ncbi:DUF6573 family protein [Streptomyces sp. NPDC056670]|uniref:DUF6573 family protein n=1 Tax=Streptomyces sp. NPDC056670 TaxID=3345904 RepID=UPI0036B5D56D
MTTQTPATPTAEQPTTPDALETAPLPRNLVRLTAQAEAAGWAVTVTTQPGRCNLLLTAPQQTGETALRCVWKATAQGYRWGGATLTRYGQQAAERITWRAVQDVIAAEAPTAPRRPAAPDLSASVPLADPGEIIHAYTRARALADGVLVAADADSAREAGFRVPVALTSAAWEDCVAWHDGDSDRQVPQDERGRLWDVLTMCRAAIRRSRGREGQVTVDLRRVPRDGHTRQARPAELVCAIGPGDHGEPVITIMQPGED